MGLVPHFWLLAIGYQLLAFIFFSRWFLVLFLAVNGWLSVYYY